MDLLIMTHKFVVFVFLQEVKDLFTGIVKMLDTGDVVKIDQTYLETVIPALGKWLCGQCKSKGKGKLPLFMYWINLSAT